LSSSYNQYLYFFYFLLHLPLVLFFLKFAINKKSIFVLIFYYAKKLKFTFKMSIYGTCSLATDVEELDVLVEYLRENRKIIEISLLGHSTGITLPSPILLSSISLSLALFSPSLLPSLVFAPPFLYCISPFVKKLEKTEK
jgi:hypothetical protein